MSLEKSPRRGSPVKVSQGRVEGLSLKFGQKPTTTKKPRRSSGVDSGSQIPLDYVMVAMLMVAAGAMRMYSLDSPAEVM